MIGFRGFRLGTWDLASKASGSELQASDVSARKQQQESEGLREEFWYILHVGTCGPGFWDDSIEVCGRLLPRQKTRLGGFAALGAQGLCTSKNSPEQKKKNGQM